MVNQEESAAAVAQSSKIPTSPDNQQNFISLGSHRFTSGYWQGMRQSAVLTVLTFNQTEISAAALTNFDNICRTLYPAPDADAVAEILDASLRKHPVLGRLVDLSLRILEQLGMPIMGGARVLPVNSKDLHRWVIGLPSTSSDHHAPQAALALSTQLLNGLVNGSPLTAELVSAELKKLSQRFRAHAPRGINTLRFLQAAHEMEIPWRHIANNIYQFGWGRRSRWLDSSFTDQTSVISAGLARDKVAAAKVLRAAGLPVPRHQLVTSAKSAINVAQTLGYPVVIKPADLDGGVGVYAGLRDSEAVKSAYDAAGKLSKHLLIEEFVDGNDYRIRVCNGEIIGVVIRRPASIVGDGERTVRALIIHTNRERSQRKPLPDPEIEQGSKPIIIDDEVRQWLTNQDLTLESVIPAGQRVRLRGAANVNMGGTTWEVTKFAHPDNLALALSAAAALRLDVAGIDLLIADIAQSWKETGGVICEVNGQPQFTNTTAHRRMLERLVSHQGRIPVIGMLTNFPVTDCETQLVPALCAQGPKVVYARTPQECQQALLRTDTEAVLWHVDSLQALIELPVDRLSLLIHAPGLPLHALRKSLNVADHWALDESSTFAQLSERLQTYLHEHLE